MMHIGLRDQLCIMAMTLTGVALAGNSLERRTLPQALSPGFCALNRPRIVGDF